VRSSPSWKRRCSRARATRVASQPVAAHVVAEASKLQVPQRWSPPSAPSLVPLVRTPAQLEAVIAAKLPEVELDWMELVGLGRR
jgi:hypothetical protein